MEGYSSACDRVVYLYLWSVLPDWYGKNVIPGIGRTDWIYSSYAVDVFHNLGYSASNKDRSTFGRKEF